MARLYSYPLAAALLCGAAPVFAADATADSSADAGDQREIVVHGQRIEYGIKATSTAT